MLLCIKIINNINITYILINSNKILFILNLKLKCN